MKKAAIVTSFIMGSTAIAPSAFASGASTILLSQTASEDILRTISVENGKDDIFSPAPGTMSLSVYSTFKRSGEFMLYNTQVISLYDKPNGTAGGAIGPQMVVSKQRYGQWFLIDTYMGPRWIYNGNTVELRDVDDKEAKLELLEKVFLHSEPFDVYKTDEAIDPTTVNVLKQAGSWYFIEHGSEQVWVYTDRAKYVNGIDTPSGDVINGVPLKRMIVPVGNESVRPGYTLKPDYITVHNTGNTANGANAEMHGKYLLNQAASNPKTWASWHFTVDEQQIVQHLPLNESGWHAGDGSGPGNRSSIGIEIAEPADGNYAKAEENAKQLIAYLMNELQIPLEEVKAHRDWSGKYCPKVILNHSWTEFISSVQTIYEAQQVQEGQQEEVDTSVHRIVTGSFLGETNVKTALGTLQKDTDWSASYEQVGQPVSYYQIVTGEFLGESNVKRAVSEMTNETGWWMTYEKTRPAPFYYRIVTGGFYGEANVKRALHTFQKETGWWATYEKTSQPNMYRIVTGAFFGDRVKEGMSYMTKKGWWAMYEQTGPKLSYYKITTGAFFGEANAKKAVLRFGEKGWWAVYEPTGKTESYYRIVTGGFTGLEAAQQKAQWLRDTKGWWVTTEEVK